MSKNLFKIGDYVSLINETTKGVIIKLEGNTITIQSDDGFEYPCDINELTRTGDLHAIIDNSKHIEYLKDNNSDNPKKNKGKKSFPKRKIPPMEVDLHIHQLIKSNKGMSNFEMLNLQLNAAKQQLEFAIDKKVQKVVFIHGVGDGVLKNELHYLLKKYPVEIMEASYQKYGEGATEIYIFQKS